jgi:hypothetical protein
LVVARASPLVRMTWAAASSMRSRVDMWLS